MSSTASVSRDLIETVNRVVRTSRRMLTETGREPTAEELGRRLAMPLEMVRRLMTITGLPICFETAGAG